MAVGRLEFFDEWQSDFNRLLGRDFRYYYSRCVQQARRNLTIEPTEVHVVTIRHRQAHFQLQDDATAVIRY